MKLHACGAPQASAAFSPYVPEAAFAQPEIANDDAGKSLRIMSAPVTQHDLSVQGAGIDYSDLTRNSAATQCSTDTDMHRWPSSSTPASVCAIAGIWTSLHAMIPRLQQRHAVRFH